MRVAAALLALLATGCSGVLAPRIGACPGPTFTGYAHWNVQLGGTGDSDEDVWLMLKGRSGGKPCLVLVETVGCGAWRVHDLKCGMAAGEDERTL